MNLKKRIVFLALGITGIVGTILYASGNAPFISGSPLSHGYAGADCPVGIDMTVTPSTVLYGGTITISGHLIPETGADVSGESIALKRIRGGTSTTTSTATVTTDSTGFFHKSLAPFWSAFHFAQWAGTSDCSAESGGASNKVRVKVSIVRSATSVLAGHTYTLSGSVRLRHPGGHVYLQAVKKGTSTVRTTTLTLDSLGNYSHATRNFAHGVTYFFRTIFPTQDADHVGNHTAWVSVVIV